VRFADADGAVVAEFSGAIGVATNNVAEYSGLLAALRYAKEQGFTNLTVRSDSLLLVCQMRGEYKVKNPGLQKLHAEARRLVWELGRVRFEHVRREANAEADRLANEAMDLAT
jgi:probable phosphoglycerate mutase